jgi:hypothetical protein
MSIPKINKSASLNDKQAHITKHSSSVPMLNMFIKQGILVVDSLDETACDAVLSTNNMLALDELTRDQVILDKLASKVDSVMRVPQTVTDALSTQGIQSTEGMMKVNFSTVLLVHRNHDTDLLVDKLTSLIKENVDLILTS